MKISDMTTNVSLNAIMNESGYMEEYMDMAVTLFMERNRKLETAFVMFYREYNEQLRYFFDRFSEKKVRESNDETSISDIIKGHVIDLFTKMMES